MVGGLRAGGGYIGYLAVCPKHYPYTRYHTHGPPRAALSLPLWVLDEFIEYLVGYRGRVLGVGYRAYRGGNDTMMPVDSMG